MVKAFELEPSVFADSQHTAEDNFRDWMQRMLGGKKEDGKAVFSCSAMVSGAMLRHAQQQHDFKAIAAKTKPPAW
jgi:hypothetical protein